MAKLGPRKPHFIETLPEGLSGSIMGTISGLTLAAPFSRNWRMLLKREVMPPNTGAHHAADLVAILFGYLQAGVLDGLLRGVKAEVGYAVRAPYLASTEEAAGVKVAHFTGEVILEPVRVEAGDGVSMPVTPSPGVCTRPPRRRCRSGK